MNMVGAEALQPSNISKILVHKHLWCPKIGQVQRLLEICMGLIFGFVLAGHNLRYH